MTTMTYISAQYYLLLALALFLYYLFPLKKRWTVLLSGSIAFFALADLKGLPEITASIVCSFLFAKWIQNKPKKIVLMSGILISCVPLWIHLYLRFSTHEFLSILQPIGVSYFSLQMIAYLSDVFYKKIQAEKNIFHYALFILFFPQIIQGPIPRYDQLQKQLIEGHLFNEKGFTKGIQLIIWGFFLKLMIADKAAIAVNSAFDHLSEYSGIYAFLLLVLYFIQLYADFLACTTLSQGAAQLFNITLVNNFNRPFFSISTADFWRRWHMSLGAWLKDYIYIPLGGSRKGKLRKYWNIILVFLVSGIWHGAGISFLVWGLMQAFYQIVGSLTSNLRDRIWRKLHVNPEGRFRHYIQVICTFILITISWAPFRAYGMRNALSLLKSLLMKPAFMQTEPGFFMNLEWKEWIVLILSILILFLIDLMQEKGHHIRDEILLKKPAVNWILSIGCILMIVVFGTYGYGYNAQSFIYGGF